MDEKHRNLFFMEHLHFWTFIMSFKPKWIISEWQVIGVQTSDAKDSEAKASKYRWEWNKKKWVHAQDNK